MKNKHLLIPNWEKIVLFLLLHFTITYSQFAEIESLPDSRSSPPVTYNYDRIDEVKKQCSSILDSTPELKSDDNRIYNIKKDLSFLNGDWWQGGNNEAPLMPLMNASSGDLSPEKLASFWVTDVARSQPSKKYIIISAIMQMGITSGSLFEHKPYEEKARFDIWPGQSQLSIIFQGIYMENNERVMCLLGETMLPQRDQNTADPWEWVRESGFTNQPPLLQDEQILLILHYPKISSLTNRAIQGSMRSLNPKENLKYFDKVLISSWLGTSANYEFGSEKLITKVCSPLYEDKFTGSDIDLYKGFDFCLILQRMSGGEGITIVPNWKCNVTDEFCSKLGPFSSDKLINATDGSFKGFQLVLQDVQCKGSTLENNKLFKVSSVFRVVEPLENSYLAGRRTGVDNMTLSAEGEWNSTSGKLCMIGCIGLSNNCNSSIILYIPLQFSINQRSVIMGTISSIEKINPPYFPLSFEMLTRTSELWDLFTAARPHYKYLKISQAGAVLERDEPFNFGTVIKNSFLKYPKVETTEALSVGLSRLAEDLTLQTGAYPRANIQLEIIAVGSLFGRYWSSHNGTNLDGEKPYKAKSEYTEKQLLLNVSAQLTLSQNSITNISTLFLEGLYDEHVGKMYLIGCRDVRASWKVLYESMDLENGLDCLVEAIISYPPTTARWLVNPTATISISSQRNSDDPLYFKPIKIQTFPLMYRSQREDIVSRRGIEGILKILTLSVAIACILSQLFYIRDKLECVPFISLVMLGVQALGYSLPLITGAETIFKKMGSESYENQSYGLSKNQWLQVIDYTVKLLILACFLVTIRIFQKVWKSRIRLLTRAPLEPHRVPSDKRVLIINSVIHIIGYIFVLVFHYAKTSQMPRRTQSFADFDGNSQKVWEWETELEEYMGLIQDFFLLPQIIANFIWEIDTKPLRKFYFLGLTAVRVLPHIYDLIKSPTPNPYFSEEYEFVNPRYDFYSKFGDVAIPVMGIVFAAIVYAQQKWKYEKIRETLAIGNRKLLPLGSRVYERLPSKSVEAELVSGANEDSNCRDEDHDSD